MNVNKKYPIDLSRFFKKSIFVLAFIGLMVPVSVFSQHAKGLQLGISVLPGLGNVKLDEETLTGGSLSSDLKFGLHVQADAGFFFSENIGVGVGLGYARYASENVYDNWGMKRVFEATPTGTDYYDFDNPDVRYGYTLYDTMQISRELLTVSSIDLPVLLKLRFGSPDELSFYADVGPVFSFANQGNYEGEGTASFQGEFDELDVYVFDTGFGFGEEVGISTVKKDLPGFSGFNISVMGGVGVMVPIKENLMLKVGGVYKRGISDLISSGGEAEIQSQIKEGSSEYFSLAAGSDNVSTSHFGAQVGIQYVLGQKGTKTPREPRKKGCDELETIPVKYKQFEANRRGQGQDPEFLELLEEAKKYIAFRGKKTTLIAGTLGDYVEYCPNQEQLFEVAHYLRKNTYFKEMDETRGAVSEKIYEIKLASKRYNVSLMPIDGKSQQELGDFRGEVLYRGVTVATLNGMYHGESVKKLYAHPEIDYQLQISLKGYNDTIVTLRRDDVLAGIYKFPLNRQGLRTLAVIPGFEGVPNQKLEIFRSELGDATRTRVNDGKLEIQVAPDKELPARYVLQLEKPIGYDIYQGYAKPDWRRNKVTLRMKEGEPDGEVTIEKLPTFHLFYIDLSDTDQRKEIQDTLNRWFQVIRKSKTNDEYFAFLTNGDNSLETTHKENPNDFLVTVGLVNPDPPNGDRDREKILEALFNQLDDLPPNRKQLRISYFLSQTIHEQSLLELEDKLVRRFGSGWENIQIRIYTHYPVKPEDRIQGKFKQRVEYIELK